MGFEGIRSQINAKYSKVIFSIKLFGAKTSLYFPISPIKRRSDKLFMRRDCDAVTIGAHLLLTLLPQVQPSDLDSELQSKPFSLLPFLSRRLRTASHQFPY